MLDRISQLLMSWAPTRPQAAANVLILTAILLIMIWERRHPAYPMDHRRTWKRDVMVQLAYVAAIAPMALMIGRYASFTPAWPRQALVLPFAVRLALFFVIGDFGFYWVHRAMHTKWLWNLHRWHHSPTYMYWLMGARASVLQQVLVNSPFFLAQGLLAIAPWWTSLAIYLKNALQNYWMHINVHWGSRWLEWIVVTPRYHHIHHSNDPAYYGANVAAIFPIWDRLFGTYIDPEKVPRQHGFGTDEKTPVWRLALGL
jgi:sterol desaturase/sphingolipid hydroxylase (fatty acid hydroxylase superfamily)